MPITSHITPTTIPHLLLMPPNWIGDVIMAQPALRCITEHYRQHCGTERISIYGRPWLKDLLPYLNLPNAHYLPELAAADVGFLFPNSFRAAWQARQAGVKHIIGYRGQWRSLLLHQPLIHRIDTQHEHHRHFHLDIARQLHIKVNNTAVSLAASTHAQHAGQQFMQGHALDPQRVICIAPGAQFGAAKCYPPAGFQMVIRSLAQAGWQPLILGMPEDYDAGQYMLEGITTAHCNAAGITSMAEVLSIISASQLMLCNDSGLMHVAAGLNIPTVTPFGATDPARTSPSGSRIKVLYQPAACSPCLQRECSVDGHPCMANITPNMLLDACNAMLTQSSNPVSHE